MSVCKGHLGQQLDGLPVVAHGKGLEAEHRLQFDQCSRRVCSRCPYSSQLDADLELVGDQFQQGRKRRLIDARDDTVKAQEQSCTAKLLQLVGSTRRCRMMERSVSLNVVTDQLILGVRQRQQAFMLGGGQD